VTLDTRRVSRLSSRVESAFAPSEKNESSRVPLRRRRMPRPHRCSSRRGTNREAMRFFSARRESRDASRGGVSRVRSKRGFERQSKMSTPTTTTTTRRAIDSHRFFASYRGPIALATTKQSRENPHGGCSAPRRGLTNRRKNG